MFFFWELFGQDNSPSKLTFSPPKNGVKSNFESPNFQGSRPFRGLLGGGFKHFYFHAELWGRWTHFDEHIFQRGWFNHQLDCYEKEVSPIRIPNLLGPQTTNSPGLLPKWTWRDRHARAPRLHRRRVFINKWSVRKKGAPKGCLGYIGNITTTMVIIQLIYYKLNIYICIYIYIFGTLGLIRWLSHYIPLCLGFILGLL